MLVVKSKKALVFRLRDPGRILNVIPTAKTLDHKGQTFVVVPHRVEETTVLRNLGFTVPAPVGYYYSWPGKYTPFEAQKKTVEFLTQNSRAFCNNDIGTGKTISLLWAYDYLRARGLHQRALVVTPLSTLERTWADEVFCSFPHLNAAVLHGSRQKRIKLLADRSYDLYLINHDGLEIIQDELKDRDDISLVIVDELAQLYGGQLSLDKSALGGLRAELSLPATAV